MGKWSYWTFETVKEEASKYNTRGEFSKGNSPAYQYARKKNWLDIVCEHMVSGKKKELELLLRQDEALELQEPVHV